MKLSELKQRVDDLVEGGFGEDEVVVKIESPKDGKLRTRGEVARVGMLVCGFDWEKGRIFLVTDKTLAEVAR